MPLLASGGKVVIEVFDNRDKTRGGVLLPSQYSENNAFVPTQGIIRSIGPKSRIPELKVGMKVMVEKYKGDKVQYEGKDYLILFEQYIVAILPDDYDVSIREEDKTFGQTNNIY